MPNQTVTRAYIWEQGAVLQSMLNKFGVKVGYSDASDAVAMTHGFKNAEAVPCGENTVRHGLPTTILQAVPRVHMLEEADGLQSTLNRHGIDVSVHAARDAVARAHGFKSIEAVRCWEKGLRLGLPAEALSEFTL